MSSHELYRRESPSFRSVSARVDGDSFVIDTQDMGPLVKETWGDSDYEFWTTVPKAAWGDLLLALAREYFDNDDTATDRLRVLCRKYGGAHQWQSWA